MKCVLAATMATSVVAVAQPAQAATSTTATAEKAVVKAEKLARQISNQTTLSYRLVHSPKNAVGYPDMKVYNQAKTALADAKKAVAKTKGSQKKVLEARLSANVSIKITRAAYYIDAVATGLKIQAKQAPLQTRYKQGIVDDQTEKLYHALSQEIKLRTARLDKVYGVSTRNEIRNYYKKPAEQLIQNLLYPISIKMEIDRAAAAMKANDYATAAQRLGNVDYLTTEAEKKGLKKSSKLIQTAMTKYKATLAEFNKTSVLYQSSSTNEAKPTIIGESTGAAEQISKNVYLYAGLNQHLKLQNVSIDGTLTVLGSPAGAGTVSLDGVSVSKSIVVKDVADHSLYLKDVKAPSMIVNDTNGANIVTTSGVTIDALYITKSASNGKLVIQSPQTGAFGSITIDSSGDIVLSGDFSGITINVTGENAKIVIAKDAKIGELHFSTGASVKVEAGAEIAKVTKDGSVTGTITIDNKGTIKDADSSIVVVGTPPGSTTPTPPPSSGGGAGQAAPVFNKVTALLSGDVNVSGTGSIDLTAVNDKVLFQSIQVTASSPIKSLEITKLTARGSNDNLIANAPATVAVGPNGIISIKDLFGALDTGANGIALENLRAVFLDQPIQLEGKLVGTDNQKSSQISIAINLGSGSAQITSFKNDFATITKNVGTKTVTIDLTDDAAKRGKTIEQLQGGSIIGIKNVFSAITPDTVVVDYPELEFENKSVSKSTLIRLFDTVTLDELVGLTVRFNGYTITFI